MANQYRSKNDTQSRAPLGAGRQAIEGNALTEDEVEMFQMFDREDWSSEQRRAHILVICDQSTGD